MRKRDRDRAEALRLAGGRPPSLRNRAVALGVQSRGQVDWIESKPVWLFGPCRADGFVRCEAVKGLEAPGEVVSVEEGS